MDRYGASAREYSRNDDFDTYHPRRTGGANDRAYGRGDSTRERATFHGGRGGTTDRFTSDDDESEYEPRGGHRQHHRAGAGAAGVRSNGTRRRREDPLIEQLRREVREDEARLFSGGSRFGADDYSDDNIDDDDGDSDFAHHRTVMPRGVTRTGGGVRTGTSTRTANANSGTHHRRHRRQDPVIEQLRREVREDEARLSSSGSRAHYSDDSEGETEFGRRLEREVRSGRRGDGVRSPPSRRGYFDDGSEDEGMERGRRGGFCGGRPSGY